MRARSASQQAPSSSRQPRASATLVPASQICTPYKCVLFLRTEDRSAEMLPGSERDVEGGRQR